MLIVALVLGVAESFRSCSVLRCSVGSAFFEAVPSPDTSHFTERTLVNRVGVERMAVVATFDDHCGQRCSPSAARPFGAVNALAVWMLVVAVIARLARRSPVL